MFVRHWLTGVRWKLSKLRCGYLLGKLEVALEPLTSRLDGALRHRQPSLPLTVPRICCRLRGQELRAHQDNVGHNKKFMVVVRLWRHHMTIFRRGHRTRFCIDAYRGRLLAGVRTCWLISLAKRCVLRRDPSCSAAAFFVLCTQARLSRTLETNCVKIAGFCYHLSPSHIFR